MIMWKLKLILKIKIINIEDLGLDIIRQTINHKHTFYNI